MLTKVRTRCQNYRRRRQIDTRCHACSIDVININVPELCNPRKITNIRLYRFDTHEATAYGKLTIKQTIQLGTARFHSVCLPLNEEKSV